MKITVTIDTDHPLAPTEDSDTVSYGVSHLQVQRAIEGAIVHMKVLGSTGASYSYEGSIGTGSYITAEVSR